MEFVLSYSCGKDSTLALARMVAAGHWPVGLLVMRNAKAKRSWFHGVDDALLHALSASLNLPLISCSCEGEAYHTAMEEGLQRAKRLGATACVFGDIFIAENAAWCRERCERVGLIPLFPLWGEGRKALVEEVLSLGYTAYIKCIQNDRLPKSLLGQRLSKETVAAIEAAGADVCGENGEYHTLVTAGPLFSKEVPLTFGERLDFGKVSVVDIRLQEIERG